MTGHLTNNKSWLNWPIRSINIQRLILSTIPDHFESEDEYCTGFWKLSHCQQQPYSTCAHLDNHIPPTYVIVPKKICFERRSKSLFRKLLLACTFNLHALLFEKMSMKTLRLRRFYDIVDFLKDLLPTSFPGSCPTRSPWRERERGWARLLLVSFVCEVYTALYIYSLPTDLWSFSFFKEI